MQYSAEIINLRLDYETKKPIAEILLHSDEVRELEEYKNKGTPVDIEIDSQRSIRSNQANRYLWKLITELGNKLRKSKEELYFEMLKNYGQSDFISVKSEIDVKPYFKYFEKAGEGKIGDKNFTHYKVYKGSSEMDSKEFSILMDGVIQECNEQEIPIRPKEEIESMIKNIGG